ncbi:MAG: nicotinate-nucleotide diphosphorylase (carboxylating), partial [Flavobacteriales bacterium]|nr:nicotinate-nucleotide diphosphorylase (carboxylating) [Flavobacteriales bacterium]
YDMILIKDNHIDFAGGITQAINRVNNYLKSKQLQIPIEIEVRSMEELQQVLEIGMVDRILLDNFSPNVLKKGVALVNGRFQTEASGGITELNIASYAETGVDFISVGALTHHVNSIDLSLKANLTP